MYLQDDASEGEGHSRNFSLSLPERLLHGSFGQAHFLQHDAIYDTNIELFHCQSSTISSHNPGEHGITDTPLKHVGKCLRLFRRHKKSIDTFDDRLATARGFSCDNGTTARH